MVIPKRFAASVALTLAILLSIGGFVGCGGGGGAKMARADAVVVTYYYLPL